MLSFRVILAQHSRRSPLPRHSSHLPSHLPLLTVVHPLSVQPLTKCSSRNSFVLKTIHFDGGVYPPHRRSDVQTCNRFHMFPSYPLCIDILANSFARTKTSTLFFSSNSKLFAQKHPGGGVPPASSRIAVPEWLGHSARKCSALSRGAADQGGEKSVH